MTAPLPPVPLKDLNKFPASFQDWLRLLRQEVQSSIGSAVTHTLGNLTTSALMIGNGGGDSTVLNSLGSTTTVLHGNAAGSPTWGAVNLGTDVTGSLSSSLVSGLSTIATSGAITDATGTLLVTHGGTGVTTSTGSGNTVLSTSPTLVTPVLGVASATSINGNTFTTGTYTLTGSAGKTLTFDNSLELAGTDSTKMTFPSTSATIARTDAANTFTGIQTFNTPIAASSVATMTATVGGGVPTPPNNTTTFLRGDGTFASQGSASLSSLTSSLGANVALNNTSNFIDGPSVAQGNSGTWFVIASVSVFDAAVGGASFAGKLWDGTTVIASGVIVTGATGGQEQMCLAGVISSPAGNLRISIRDFTSVNGEIEYNSSGLSKDSTITAIRIT